MRVVACLHDIGKATPWFQARVRGEPENAPTDRHPNHSLQSAYVTLHALSTLDVSHNCRIAAWWAVTKHHSVIPNVKDATTEYTQTQRPQTEQKYDRVADQLTKTDTFAPDIADQLVREATAGVLTWSEIYTTTPEEYSIGLKLPPSGPDPRLYHTILRIWTTLTCADKLDAAGINLSQQLNKQATAADAFDPATIQQYIDDELPNATDPVVRELNELRTRARRKACKAITADDVVQDPDQNVFTLTLPTGFGKTFAGLAAAFDFCNEGGVER